MSGRCERCPVPAGLSCYESDRYCRRAGEPGNDAFRAMLVRHARIRAGQAEPRPVSKTVALLDRMRACPNFVRRSDCGCGVNECRAGKGCTGLVSHADCFACLEDA
jgi:hypothetical protein